MHRGRGVLFGATAVTYAAEAVDEASSRMICRLSVAHRGTLDRVRAWPLSAGDWVMMRKQLHTLRDYAERDAARLTRSTNGS